MNGGISVFTWSKKTLSVYAPVSGKLINLSEVPDATFAEGLVGSGIAIEAESSIVVAPVDGELIMIFRTNHAFALRTPEGIELLVHVGMDTVELQGEGFERTAQEGDKVKVGDPILKIDIDFLKQKQIVLVTPVIITTPSNKAKFRNSKNSYVEKGKDIILTYSY